MKLTCGCSFHAVSRFFRDLSVKNIHDRQTPLLHKSNTSLVLLTYQLAHSSAVPYLTEVSSIKEGRFSPQAMS